MRENDNKMRVLLWSTSLVVCSVPFWGVEALGLGNELRGLRPRPTGAKLAKSSIFLRDWALYGGAVASHTCSSG